jgi:hypothetical protein
MVNLSTTVKTAAVEAREEELATEEAITLITTAETKARTLTVTVNSRIQL